MGSAEHRQSIAGSKTTSQIPRDIGKNVFESANLSNMKRIDRSIGKSERAGWVVARTGGANCEATSEQLFEGEHRVLGVHAQSNAPVNRTVPEAKPRSSLVNPTRGVCSWLGRVNVK